MGQSLASKIEAANSAMIVNGNVDAIGEFFTPDMSPTSRTTR